MKYAISVPEMSVVVSFDNGKKLYCIAKNTPDAMRDLLFLYGLKQKLSDSAASALKASAANGRNIEDQRYAMVNEMIGRIEDGSAFDRQSDGIGRVSYLIQAVEILYALSPEDAAEKVKNLPEDKQKALVASPKIAAEIARLKMVAAAKALAKIEADAIDDDDELPEL